MIVLDNIYRVFMFILPFAICFATYVWMGKKAWRVQQKTARMIALIVIAGGIAFTMYRMVVSVVDVFTNDIFEYIALLVMVAVLALASIVMAIGEPEEENRSADKQGMLKEEGKENGLQS